jgi:hypothetical protein
MFRPLTLIATSIVLALAAAEETPGGIPWQAWEAKDVAALDDDHTGAQFALSDEVMTPTGQSALQVTPSGTAEETKVAMAASGEDLADWQAGELELEVYTPHGRR